MGVLITGNMLPSDEVNQRADSDLIRELPYILASEVIAEMAFRCENGIRFTTFPNRISEVEKTKLEEAGYYVTENIIESSNRDGAADLYIGFQVSLNADATKRSMVISQKETNGIGEGRSPSISIMSAADYTALRVKDPSTLYIVQYDGFNAIYVGEVPIQDLTAIHGDGTIKSLVAVSEMPQIPDANTLYVEEASS